MEGAHPGGSLMVSKWPDKAAALAFWNSSEYQEVKKLRNGVADCQVLLVEDRGPRPTAAATAPKCATLSSAPP